MNEGELGEIFYFSIQSTTNPSRFDFSHELCAFPEDFLMVSAQLGLFCLLPFLLATSKRHPWTFNMNSIFISFHFVSFNNQLEQSTHLWHNVQNIAAFETKSSLLAGYVRIVVGVIIEIRFDTNFTFTLTQLAIIWYQFESNHAVRILLQNEKVWKFTSQ